MVEVLKTIAGCCWFFSPVLGLAYESLPLAIGAVFVGMLIWFAGDGVEALDQIAANPKR